MEKKGSSGKPTPNALLCKHPKQNCPLNLNNNRKRNLLVQRSKYAFQFVSNKKHFAFFIQNQDVCDFLNQHLYYHLVFVSNTNALQERTREAEEMRNPQRGRDKRQRRKKRRMKKNMNPKKTKAKSIMKRTPKRRQKVKASIMERERKSLNMQKRYIFISLNY